MSRQSVADKIMLVVGQQYRMHDHEADQIGTISSKVLAEQDLSDREHEILDEIADRLGV